ncbi:MULTISPECIES: glutaminase A [Brachybacterium]|uniref:Glutaminase n=1 Tax=Brachybacterium alimentarium TaxID=47845 RepID=A0A2A3YH04_9MICO|nr:MULTISPECIES: glutaminase A [Brachybacterium]PCC30972.1 glutaminase A [Brachybacterium alimentarium]PCC38551.1 glutaminase A [Brachybacterium alimentarium]RCS59180.1 glutaminase A [Brachybacterium sp. JB7]RCS68300.1 glutaminase A [Brachybacterium alimentarium]RCS81940.1 glutaminase A [Brachybacterium alimentarium]
MRSPILDYLDRAIEQTAHVAPGAPADYIPELASADPQRIAVAMSTINGTVYASGDADHHFTIQSISKPFVYAQAIEERGLEDVLARIGVEPSGEAFNELSLDPDTGMPRNPMINAGAIATHALLSHGARPADERILELFSQLAEREIEIDEAVAASEAASAHRNLGLAHLLRAAGALDQEPQDAVDGYIRQCAASVTVRDLALMAATLANGGVQPNTGERLFSRTTTRHLLGVMTSCGMYDAAGDWLTTVGIPAKSGVAGGIVGVLPGQLGIAVFSPGLDAHGNSSRGVAMMQHLSEELHLHLMEPARPARSSLRETRTVWIDEHRATLYVLQGDLVLSSVESLVERVLEDPPTTERVVFDMSRVDEVLPVARHVAGQMAKKLIDDGHRIVLIDRDGVTTEVPGAAEPRVERWTREQLDRSAG